MSLPEDAALFSDNKIAHTKLPDGYILRPLQLDDADRGYLTILHALVSSQPPLSKEAFNRRFEELYAANQVWPSTLVVVILDENERVATTGTLLLERKFLRAAAIAGHIEDIAVRPDQQGKGLGRILIEALTGIAQRQGCYKVILDCEERNVPFYEKCAYERAGVEMKKYL